MSAPKWGEAGVLRLERWPSEWPRSFRYALHAVAESEGGDSDHPSDPGGKTRWGVTQRTYHAWLRSKGMPLQDVETMDAYAAAMIYWERYWVQGECGLLIRPLAIAHFDAMVQHGPGGRGTGGAVGATHLLQRALEVKDDGIIGPKTRSAMRNAKGSRAYDLLLERLLHYWRILDNRPDLRVFSRGWRNRMKHLRAEVVPHLPRTMELHPPRLGPPRLEGFDPRPLPLPQDARRRAA